MLRFSCFHVFSSFMFLYIFQPHTVGKSDVILTTSQAGGYAYRPNCRRLALPTRTCPMTVLHKHHLSTHIPHKLPTSAAQLMACDQSI